MNTDKGKFFFTAEDAEEDLQTKLRSVKFLLTVFIRGYFGLICVHLC
jgi:hypothetical protein